MSTSRTRTFYRRYRFEIISFVVGAVELTLELTASRVAAPYIGLTIYVWTSVIGVILAALALGYLLGGRLADKRKDPLDVVFLLLGAAVLIGFMNAVKDPLLTSLSGWSFLPSQLQALLASCVLFAAPTIVLGAVTPYLARLSVIDVATSGTHVSRINAAGTFGALFGTFFTGFFLFTLVGTRNILALLGFTLVLMSFGLALPKQNKMRWLLVGLALLVLFVPSKLHLNGVRKDFDTAYNRYIIRETPEIRVLQGDKSAWESGIYKDERKGPLFPYIKTFVAAAALPERPRNYLVIGGGAFTLPTLLAQSQPQATVDVVEIDKALQSISEQYFRFKPSLNIHVFTQDGRQYLNNNHKKYDVIYMDAFSNSTPPFQLLTQETNERLRASLAPGGVVAVNIVSKTAGTGAVFVSSVAQTYQHAFIDVRLFRITDAPAAELQNVLLLASQESLAPKIAAASQNSVLAAATHNELSVSNGGRVLRDDFAPVEQMVAWQE
ncbi:MAG TPA: fused MFS/spermidine synthase [Candidatus Saccharimonadales bacterium]|nr:fused MFS/spermidine synthase [Candidatus Saccharimonadales bacterium]